MWKIFRVGVEGFDSGSRESGSCSDLKMEMSEDGDFDEDGKGRDGEKWSDLGYILKIEQTEVSEKLIMGCDRN